jgi:hypothetical protein
MANVSFALVLNLHQPALRIQAEQFTSQDDDIGLLFANNIIYTKFGSPIPAIQASNGFCAGVSSKAEMMLSTHGELYSAP